VFNGSISDRAPMKVVLPTPNPPEMTILAGIGGRAVASVGLLSTEVPPTSGVLGFHVWGVSWIPRWRSESGDTGDEPFKEGDVLADHRG